MPRTDNRYDGFSSEAQWLRFGVLQIALMTLLFSVSVTATRAQTSTVRYHDGSDGQDWPGYGRTFGEQHFSPLAEVGESNIGRLGLAWSMELGPENSATEAVAVDGVLYFATGLSIVHAVDATSGRLLWRYDPEVATRANRSLRLAWGVRGVAWWNGRIYTGTQDGRLIALDAKTGAPVWSQQTLDPGQVAHINGAPRVFDGTVVVGHAGLGRAFATAYDAETGRRIWRFYPVPGDPAKGFVNKVLAKAADTWAGEWWKEGGGGNIWNGMAYDPESHLIYLGTGSGFPWNRRVRSADRGDNLFVASIVALDLKTGAYRWHYQVTPGDTWDFDAAMDIELANISIAGEARKVLMQAAKNGFFYVIDRLTGRLISAQPYAQVTWARRIDLRTGRPVEAPRSRYPLGTSAAIWPSELGAHSWMPMAYSAESGLSYIPVIEAGRWWSERPSAAENGESSGAKGQEKDLLLGGTGKLVAWNPVSQQAIWSVPYPTFLNGGILVTAGSLVFQGTVDGLFKAYAATTGQLLWTFDAHTPIMAAPISYAVNGHQYISLLTGNGMGTPGLGGMLGDKVERYAIDPRSQLRRVLTFALDSHATLPAKKYEPTVISDPEFRADARSAAVGERVYQGNCALCHGVGVIAMIHAPDLRRSGVPMSAPAFSTVVHGGALKPKGMPDFPELTSQQLADLRQYIRTEAAKLRGRESEARQEDHP